MYEYKWLKNVFISNVGTFIISGSLQGPLLDLRQPPSMGQVQDPPKKSGNWLKKTEEIQIWDDYCPYVIPQIHNTENKPTLGQ